MTMVRKGARSQLDVIEDGALSAEVLAKLVGGRGPHDKRQDVNGDTAAALTAVDPAAAPLAPGLDAPKTEPAKSEPAKSDASKNDGGKKDVTLKLGPVELKGKSDATPAGWSEKKGAWVAGKEIVLNELITKRGDEPPAGLKTNDPKKAQDVKPAEKTSEEKKGEPKAGKGDQDAKAELAKAAKDLPGKAKDAAKQMVKDAGGKLSEGYYSLAKDVALKTAENERAEAFAKIRGQGGAASDGKIVASTTADGQTTGISFNPDDKSDPVDRLTGNWDPVKAGSKGLTDTVKTDKSTTYTLDKRAETIDSKYGRLTGSETLNGEVKETRSGSGGATKTGGTMSEQTGTVVYKETGGKTLELKTPDVLAREGESKVRTGASAEKITSVKSGAIESTTTYAAGVKADASKSSKLHVGGATVTGEGSAEANASARAGSENTLKLGQHVEHKDKTEVAAAAGAKAKGDVFVDKKTLTAGANGEAQAIARASIERTDTATIAKTFEASQKLQGAAKTMAVATGSAQISALGGSVNGEVKVSGEAEVKQTQTLGIKQLGASVFNENSASGKGQAGASAGGSFGLLSSGVTAKAAASVEAQAQTKQGLDVGTGTVSMGTKVFVQAKAEAKAEFAVSANIFDKLQAKGGVGAMASIGGGVSNDYAIGDKGGHNSTTTVTVLSPGAVGGKVDFDCSAKGGEVKIKIGGGLGVGLFGVKLNTEVNLNFKPQHNAVVNAIAELKTLTPEGVQKAPEKVATTMIKAAEKASDTLIKEGQKQGGLAGKVTEASGHALKAVTEAAKPVVDKVATPVVEKVVKPVIKTVETVVKPITNAVNSAWNWFTGLFRR